MIANILTKSLNKSKHAHCINKLKFKELPHHKAFANNNYNMHQLNPTIIHTKEECSP
jgi:hypothetical protein